MRSASVPPNTARNHTSPPKKPVSVPVCSTGKVQDFVEIARQRSEGRVIGKPLEQLADVGDPEGTLKAYTNVAPTLRKAQYVLLNQFSISSSQLSLGLVHLRSAQAGNWLLPEATDCFLESFASTCAADIPLTRITLFRLLSPAAIVTDECGTFKTSARNSMQAWLARPSTGGAVKASFSASPTSPVMAFFFARGCTFTWNVAPDEVSRMGIMVMDGRQRSRCRCARRSSLPRLRLRSRGTCPWRAHQVDRRQVSCGETVTQFAELAKVGARSFGIVW